MVNETYIPEAWSAGETKPSSTNGRRGRRSLTKREWEVLGLVATGYSNEQIASGLGISGSTIKTHLHKIYAKLRVRTRLAASLYFLAHTNLEKEGRTPLSQPSHPTG